MTMMRMPVFTWMGADHVAFLLLLVACPCTHGRAVCSCSSTATSRRTSSRRPSEPTMAATRSCGSTSSGCSAIPRSTSSSCLPWESSRRSCPRVLAQAAVRLRGFVVFAGIAIGFLGFGPCGAHHMFTDGAWLRYSRRRSSVWPRCSSAMPTGSQDLQLDRHDRTAEDITLRDVADVLLSSASSPPSPSVASPA